MAIKSAELRNDQAANFASIITAGANGMKLEIFDNEANLLATFTGLSFSAGATGVQEVSGLPVTVQASATGTADNATISSDEDTPRTVSGITVGTSDTQVIIDNTSINSGQDVKLVSLAWTVPEGVN